MKDEYFQRVFIHELGHFVANEIVYKNFGFRKTETMFLRYMPDQQDFVGGCKPFKPVGIADGIIVNHAEYLLSLFYGCLFETYKNGLDAFNKCFEINGHGDADVRSFSGRRPEVIPQGKETEALWQLLDSHVEFVEETNALDGFWELIGQDYISTVIDDEFQIDLEKLRGVVYPQLAVIESLFLDLLQKVKIIIQRNKIQT